MKRRITIFTRETFERVAFACQPTIPTGAWCEACGAQVEMLVPEEAARLASVTTRMIYRGAEAGLIHFAETADGLLLVCRKSLTGRPDPPPRQPTGEI